MRGHPFAHAGPSLPYRSRSSGSPTHWFDAGKRRSLLRRYLSFLRERASRPRALWYAARQNDLWVSGGDTLEGTRLAETAKSYGDLSRVDEAHLAGGEDSGRTLLLGFACALTLEQPALRRSSAIPLLYLAAHAVAKCSHCRLRRAARGMHRDPASREGRHCVLQSGDTLFLCGAGGGVSESSTDPPEPSRREERIVRTRIAARGPNPSLHFSPVLLERDEVAPVHWCTCGGHWSPEDVHEAREGAARLGNARGRGHDRGGDGPRGLEEEVSVVGNQRR